MQEIFEKVKTLIHNIQLRCVYNSCYNAMEDKGIAIFCMCGGEVDENGKQIDCGECPYYVGAKR